MRKFLTTFALLAVASAAFATNWQYSTLEFTTTSAAWYGSGRTVTADSLAELALNIQGAQGQTSATDVAAGLAKVLNYLAYLLWEPISTVNMPDGSTIVILRKAM